MGATFDYLRFVFGLLPGEKWVSYYNKAQKKGEDPLKDVSPFVRNFLLRIPFISLPTIFILFFEIIAYIFLIWCGEVGYLSYLQLLVILPVLQFMIFTPGHDSAHGSISTNPFINGLVGRIAFECLGPISVFAGWRELHLRHHKFTNDPDKDPDRYACNGPTLLLPFRWFTTISQYVLHWLWLSGENGEIPFSQKIECTLNLTLNASICTIAYELGYDQVFWYWTWPSFFCHGLLVFSFDFLPHFQHSITPITNRYQTTSNIETYSFLQPFLSVFLHYQDYHLMHHLYPTIPFYRYKAKWEEKKQFLIKKQYPKLSLKY